MNEQAFVFLDEPIIFEWLSSRNYLSPMFTEQVQEEPIDLNFLKNRLLQAVNDNIIQIYQNNRILKTTIIDAHHKPPFHYEPVDRQIFRKKEFLTKEYNEFMISKNKYTEAMTHRVRDDVFSLMRLIRVFPFLRYRIVLTDITCLHIFRLLKKVEIEFDLENEYYTRALSGAIGAYDLHMKSIDSEPPFTWPFDIKDDHNQMIFDCYVLNYQYNAVKSLIDDFNPDIFPSQLERAAIVLARRIKMQKELYKDMTLFLVDFTFSRIDMSFANLDEPFDLLPRMRDTPVDVLDLPKYFLDEDDQSLTIGDYAAKNEHLVKASNELFGMMFEWSPTMILFQVHKSLISIRNFITNKMHDSGQRAVNFIPFDDTFSAFLVAIIASDVRNLKALAEFVSTIIDEEQLSNDLSFAQTTLRGAYEWILAQNRK